MSLWCKKKGREEEKLVTYVLPLYWWWALCLVSFVRSCCRNTCGCCRHRQGATPRCWLGCSLEKCSWWCTCGPRSLWNTFSIVLTRWSKIRKLVWGLALRFISMLTWLVLVLNVITGNDAVAIKPLDPAQVHAPVLHLSDFQLRRIWWFCSSEEQKTIESALIQTHDLSPSDLFWMLILLIIGQRE